MVETTVNWIGIIPWLAGIFIFLIVLIFVFTLLNTMCTGAGQQFGLLTNFICGWTV